MWNWQTAVLERTEDCSATTRRFFLRIQNTDVFDFRPGQFITLDLPVSKKRTQRWRSYSIASAPDGSNLIELCIVRLQGGLGTTYLFDTLKIGDTLTFKGADGTFVLPEILPKKITMVATGTGIAPFRSMITNLIEKQKIEGFILPKIELYFGTRTEDGILYLSEWTDLIGKYPKFSFSVALSRQNIAEKRAFTIQNGYVHALYTEKFDPETHYYLCGWQNMIDEACANLQKLGLSPEHLHYELYG